MQLKPAYQKLDTVVLRYEELTAWLGSPDATRDVKQYLARTTELRTLEPVVTAYRQYLALLKEQEELSTLATEKKDPSIAELAREELACVEAQIEQTEKDLLLYLLPNDREDDRSVMIEIRAGAGGEEAALFAAELYRMYTMYAQKQGYTVELSYVNPTELGGYREIDFSVEGHGAYAHFRYESGVHRVQRIPTTEANGKIQTSTVTVAVLPEVDEVEVHISPQDVKMESCKSSGAGGQHINKTESAVRLIHLPTGIVVECQEQRSQQKNRERAMKMLEAKLYQRDKESRDSQIAAERRSQVGTGERCEKIRTYNFPQGRVTDHRIGKTIYSLERFLSGDMDDMITALRMARNVEIQKGNES